MVPKTVKLPIRWPVHSSLLDEARGAVQDASELDFLDKHPHCVVLSPEDGEECSTLRKMCRHINKPAGCLAVGLRSGAITSTKYLPG